MSVSIHEMLELNERKPALNKFIKFFNFDGMNYAYLNRAPFRISFAEMSDRALDIIKSFDGKRTINEIIVQSSLSVNFFDFIKSLFSNSFLLQKQIPGYPPGDLITLIFFPTTVCNLRCLYCYASAGENPPMMIDLDKAKTWINYVIDHRDPGITKVRVLFHGGGEPTNAFHHIRTIWEMIKSKCRESNLTPALHSISNGNFNNKVLNWLIEEQAVTFFSMDGDKNAHDQLRPRADGRGSFDIAYMNLKRLAEAGLRTGIRCTVTNQRIEELKALIDIGQECNVSFVNFEQASSFGRSENLNNTNISTEDFRDLFLKVWRYAVDKGIMVKGFPGIAIQAGRNFFCNTYANNAFALTPEGYLSPCPEVSLKSDPTSDTFIVGQIKDDLSIEFYEENIRKLKARVPDNVAVCKECFLEYVCNCGCSVKSYRKKKELLQVDEEECTFIQQLSPLLLRTILQEPEKFPERFDVQALSYADNRQKDIYCNYVSFYPFS